MDLEENESKKLLVHYGEEMTLLYRVQYVDTG